MELKSCNSIMTPFLVGGKKVDWFSCRYLDQWTGRIEDSRQIHSSHLLSVRRSFLFWGLWIFTIWLIEWGSDYKFCVIMDSQYFGVFFNNWTSQLRGTKKLGLWHPIWRQTFDQPFFNFNFQLWAWIKLCPLKISTSWGIESFDHSLNLEW